MWIKYPGPVTERIELLGRPELCTYLVKGDTYALLGGSMAHVFPDVLEQLNHLDIDLEKIRQLMLLHSHFDHLGMAPYFKKKLPWIKIGISRNGADILKNPKSLKVIQEYNNSLLKENDRAEQMEPMKIIREGFPVDYTLDRGLEHDLGNGVRLYTIPTPGHSVCSVTLYFPGEYALFPSDSMGVLTEEALLPMGTSNFDDFQSSIQKLNDIGAEIVCLEHCGAMTPPDGKEFLKRAKEEAKEFRSRIKGIYSENKDVGSTVEELQKGFSCILTGKGIMPEDLSRNLLERTVRFIVGLR